MKISKSSTTIQFTGNDCKVREFNTNSTPEYVEWVVDVVKALIKRPHGILLRISSKIL